MSRPLPKISAEGKDVGALKLRKIRRKKKKLRLKERKKKLRK